MKKNKILLVVLSLITLSACNTPKIDTPTDLIVNKVLIVGNSIVEHAPAPDIGWTGSWGMAASVIDSDFVHVLINKIRNVDGKCLVKYVNIADFEKNYATYNFNNIVLFREFKADIIIVKLSENVDDNTAVEKDFSHYYKNLLLYLDSEGDAAKVIVDGFWYKPQVNEIVKQVATDGKYDFVSINELSKDVTNTAKGKFTNSGVAAHPSDKGMRLIAERIWFSVEKHLKKQ